MRAGPPAAAKGRKKLLTAEGPQQADEFATPSRHPIRSFYSIQHCFCDEQLIAPMRNGLLLQSAQFDATVI
jgi:hypothetical protein